MRLSEQKGHHNTRTGRSLLKKETKVYADGQGGSLCTQKQPETAAQDVMQCVCG